MSRSVMREEANMRYTQGRAEGDRPCQPSRQTLHQGRRKQSANRRIGGEDEVCCHRRQLATSSTLVLWWSSMFMIFLASTRTVGAFSTTAPTTTSTTTSAERTKSLALSSIVELSHLEYCNAAGKMNQSGKSTSKTAAHKKSPVIFLHGLLGNKRNFSSIARSLCGRLKQPRRILGLDLRNHGDNCLLPQSSSHQHHHHDMSYTSMARDVLHFMDANDMPTAELIGHSVGGKVAQAVALLRPERVEGLVVLDIAPVTYTVDEPHWQAVTKIIQTMADKHPTPSTSDDDRRVYLSKREMDAHLRSKGVGDPNVRAFCLTNYQEGSGWKIPVDTLHSQLPTLAGFDDFATLSQQWRGDAFFVHGGQSKFVRSSHLSTIAHFFPRHMLTTIRGAGHWVHAEAPDDVTALLQQYLERHR